MQEDIYNYYATAPVFVWVIAKGDEEAGLREFFKKTHSKSQVVTYDGDEKEAKAKAILEAYKLAKTEYDRLFNDEVKAKFAKYDTDGSGAIDKEELGKLSEELGRKLTEEELTEALKDLDINKDGVIDVEEFARWWFSGFKSYSGTRRSMIKMKKQFGNAFESLV